MIKQAWLAPYPWDFVTAQNLLLCRARNAFHGPTSDCHDATRALWDEHHHQGTTLEDAVALCRRCHRMAPFCFYNGNTFAAIIRDVIVQMESQTPTFRADAVQVADSRGGGTRARQPGRASAPSGNASSKTRPDGPSMSIRAFTDAGLCPAASAAMVQNHRIPRKCSYEHFSSGHPRISRPC